MTQSAVPAVGTGVAVPAASNIDPNATRQVGEPSVNGVGTGGTSTTGTPGQVMNPAPVGTAPGPSPANAADPRDPINLANQILSESQAQLDQALKNAQSIYTQIQNVQAQVDEVQKSDLNQPANQQKLSSLNSQLSDLYRTYSTAQQNLEAANVARSSATQKVLDSVQLTPEQAKYYTAQAEKATADAASARATAKVLTDGAPGQQALVAAQAASANATAQSQLIAAQATKDKTPAEINALNAQASQAAANARQIDALLPTLIDKAKAEVGLTTAQTDLTSQQSELVKAQTRQADANTGLVNAQATLLTPAEAANQASQAALNQANIQKGLQGPVYGLQDQINAIKAIQDQVFGSAPPGADLDALKNQANSLLNQYVTAAIGGTTPYAASVAAQNAGQNIYTTQAALANQASQAAASRANAFLGTGGNVLATLAAMNANAPAGSTAMAGAFQEVMNNLAQQSGQGQFAVPAQPQAPPLPAFLQQFAAGALPGAPAAGGGTSAPVTINIGGGGGQPPATAPVSGKTTPVAAPTPVASPQPNFAVQSINDPSRGMAATGAQSPVGMPAYLAGQAAPTMDFINQLWSKELNSGAVTA